MLHFQKSYFLAALFFFFVEVFIALYVRDNWIRPYGGDVLVVVFLYCLLKTFLKITPTKAILGVLAFAFIVEGLQYFQMLKILSLEQNKIAGVVLGSHFEWPDILAYVIGALFLFAFEKLRMRFKKNSHKIS